MSLFYFKPKLYSPDTIALEWEAPTLVEKFGRDNLDKKCWAELGRETGVRTLNQNAALHLYFDLVAKELNESGQTIQEVLRHSAEISWSGDSVKNLLWRPIQKALTDKESTTTLNKSDEIDSVYEHVNVFLGEKCHIHVPFPSK